MAEGLQAERFARSANHSAKSDTNKRQMLRYDAVGPWDDISHSPGIDVCVRVRACACACVRECVCACVCVWCVCTCIFTYLYLYIYM